MLFKIRFICPVCSRACDPRDPVASSGIEAGASGPRKNRIEAHRLRHYDPAGREKRERKLLSGIAGGNFVDIRVAMLRYLASAQRVGGNFRAIEAAIRNYDERNTRRSIRQQMVGINPDVGGEAIEVARVIKAGVAHEVAIVFLLCGSRPERIEIGGKWRGAQSGNIPVCEHRRTCRKQAQYVGRRARCYRNNTNGSQGRAGMQEVESQTRSHNYQDCHSD
jgi:hypothetical protein